MSCMLRCGIYKMAAVDLASRTWVKKKLAPISLKIVSNCLFCHKDSKYVGYSLMHPRCLVFKLHLDYRSKVISNLYRESESKIAQISMKHTPMILHLHIDSGKKKRIVWCTLFFREIGCKFQFWPMSNSQCQWRPSWKCHNMWHIGKMYHKHRASVKNLNPTVQG